MEIKNAEIKYFKKGTFTFTAHEIVRHVKVLPYLSIAQSLEGSYDITLGNGTTESTGEGGFFIAPAGIEQTIVHRPDKKSRKMICRWVLPLEAGSTAAPTRSMPPCSPKPPVKRP